MHSKLSYKPSYRRKLPHIQPKGATLFVTSRLAGSLPREVVENLQRERERIETELAKIPDKHERAEREYLVSQDLFSRWDQALDESNTDVKYLSNTRIADLVAESLHLRDGNMYELIAYCIMPNHMHIVFTPLEASTGNYISLSRIMHSLKRYTAHEANIILERDGTFWQHENYDHFIRDDAELERLISYILYNPVKAGLVKEQADWKWSYCKYDM